MMRSFYLMDMLFNLHKRKSRKRQKHQELMSVRIMDCQGLIK